MKKVNTSFQSYGDAEFLKKTDFILFKMKDNDYFVQPSPPLADVIKARDKFDEDLTAAEGLGIQNVTDKNVSRKNLEAILAKLGTYVMFTAMGDEVILQSSGFDLRKDPQPHNMIFPGNVSLKNGVTSGSLKSTIKRNGFSNFSHQIAESLSEKTVWISYSTKTARFTFLGLTPGKQYWVRVEVIGARNETAFSNIASFFVG